MIKGLRYMVYMKRLIGPIQLQEKGSWCLQLSKGEVCRSQRQGLLEGTGGQDRR